MALWIALSLASLSLSHPIAPADLEVYPGQDCRRWIRNPSPAELTERDFLKVFPGVEQVEVSVEGLPEHVRGDTNPGNLEAILKLAKWLNPETILEVGTFRGRTTLALAQNTKANKIVTVDLPLSCEISGGIYGTDAEYLRVSHRPVLFAESKRVQESFADCTNREEMTKLIREQFGDQTIDLAYIDAAHTYEGVIVPFKAILPKMSPGGLIVFDDYMKPGFAPLTEAISYLSREEGYVFYIVPAKTPKGDKTISTVVFINDPSCKDRKWKEELIQTHDQHSSK